MAGRYRILQVGAGGMGRAWIDALRAEPRAEAVGVVDLRLESAQAAARAYGLGADRAATDLSAALAAWKPDAILDVTVPEAHRDVTLAALAAGCHVLGEKPIAPDLESARAMVAAARRAGRVYMVNLQRRWLPPVRAIRQAVAAGAIGKVHTVNCDFYLGAHFGGFREEMAHPLLLDMAIHHFDLMRCMAPAIPLWAYCHAFNPPGSWYGGFASATAVFGMEGPMVFTYRGSWCSEGRHTPWEGEWRLVGERGTITWDGAGAPEIEVVARRTGDFIQPMEQRALEPDASRPVHLPGTLGRFLDALDGGEPPETLAEDNIRSLAMVFAAMESAAKGAPAPVPAGWPAPG